MTIKNSLIYCVFALSLLCSCSSHRSLPVDDDSTLRMTKVQLMESLHSALDRDLPSSYYSKGASLDVDGANIPKLKANVSIKQGEELVTVMSLPFPPMEVGRARVSDSSLSVRSKLANIDIEKSFQLPILQYVECVFCGNIPPLYTSYGDKDFSHFNVSIKNDRVVLKRLSPRFSSLIELTPSMTIQSMQVSVNNDYIIIEPEDYKLVESFNIPHKLTIKASISGTSYSAVLVHKNISLNDSKSLKY